MIAIGSDHGGFHLKEVIKTYLAKAKIDFKDYGTYSCDSVDYPDIAQAVGEAVVSGVADKGVLLCGTGIGISMAANKIPGVRAALCTDSYMAKMSREHNNANILCMGERVIGTGLAEEILETWLKTDFAGGRHARRVQKIQVLETKPL